MLRFVSTSTFSDRKGSAGSNNAFAFSNTPWSRANTASFSWASASGGPFQAGGGGLKAPATRASDFRAGRSSSTVPKGSYQPGFTATDIAPVLDASRVPLAASMA